MDLARAQELFHLNHTEATLIQHLAPQRQALLKRPDLAKVISLTVDPESAHLYSTATATSTTSGAPPLAPAHS
jgi:hypothetical protein